MSDSSELLRKRRASTIAEGRVVKTMRLESLDQASPLRTSSSAGIPPPMLPSTHFSHIYSASTNALAPSTSFAEMSKAPALLSSAGTPSSSHLHGPNNRSRPLSLDSTPDVIPHLEYPIRGAIPVGSILSRPYSLDPIPPPFAIGVFPNPIRPHQSGPIFFPDVVPAADPLTLPNNNTMHLPTRATCLQPAPLNVASTTPGNPSCSTPTPHLLGKSFSQVPDVVSHATVTMVESTQSQSLSSGQLSPIAELLPRCEYDDGKHSDNQDEQQPQATHSGAARRRMGCASPSKEGARSPGHGKELPQEYWADVERVFFEFLNSICSNLDATDSKGELIHQTLMVKKMQRLSESPDFRPFKFRVQAFTNAFLEELARQGYPEERIPVKKIKRFLWNQPYISRFNEGGNKSKSKGHLIWHIDAKKARGGWIFQPFTRKLVGGSPGEAYVGLRWTWTPRIWEPQAPRRNRVINYSSPALPPWLAWTDDSLTGIPPPEAQSCGVTVEARFTEDGKEVLLAHTIHINITALDGADPKSTLTRRPRLVDDVHNPHQMLSDLIVPGSLVQRLTKLGPLIPASAAPVVTVRSQIVQVLTSAAQKVALKAQSRVVASPNQVGPELQALAKQQHVLTVAAQAVSSQAASEVPEGVVAQANPLTDAAQQVVLQAARHVVANYIFTAVSSGIPSAVAVSAVPQIRVEEVSAATQFSVAQAVHIVGHLSSEVCVLLKAKSLLEYYTAHIPIDSHLPIDP